ncbi:MAG: VanZ family protein, partial [Deltaproteobacteria bacterium]
MRLGLDYRAWRMISLAWMGLIFYLSSQTDLPAQHLFRGEDKLAHFLVFGILGFLVAGSLGPRYAETPLKGTLLIILVVIGYGALDEAHQYFVPGRDTSVMDLTADAVGGFFAAIVWIGLRRALFLRRRDDTGP